MNDQTWQMPRQLTQQQVIGHLEKTQQMSQQQFLSLPSWEQVTVSRNVKEQVDALELAANPSAAIASFTSPPDTAA